MTAYYNEIDPYAAAWLRNLIAAGHIAPGVVDERDIRDVTPEYLQQFTQCHFFAGLGGWSYALRSALWPDDRPVWTGSCPCQPFSAAGAGAGFADERHLWPHFHHLIAECKPAVIFGEQVASAAVDAWIDLVHADLEAVGYAFGSVPFPSAGVGAPHIRDRNYWVASRLGNSDNARLEGQRRGHQAAGGRVGAVGPAAATGEPLRLAHAHDSGRIGRGPSEARDGGDATRQQPERFCDAGIDGRPGPTNGFWRAADWLACRDGKWRPVEPGTFPLAHGAAARVGRLRAYGNAINVEAAKAWIETVMECIA